MHRCKQLLASHLHYISYVMRYSRSELHTVVALVRAPGEVERAENLLWVEGKRICSQTEDEDAWSSHCVYYKMRKMSRLCVRGWHKKRVAKLGCYTVSFFSSS